jgi:hypothetical protein
MGTLKTTLKVESTDLFPTPVNFTKINNNSIILGSSSFSTVQLSAGTNTLASIPAGNAFMYLAVPDSNTGSVTLSAASGGGGTVDAFDQTTITQTLGAYEQSAGPVVSFTNISSSSVDYGQTAGGVLEFDMSTLVQPSAGLYGQTNGAVYELNITAQGAGPYEQATPGPIFSLDPTSIVPGAAAPGFGLYLVTPTTSGAGTGATLYVEVNAGTPNAIFVNNPGDGYLPGDTMTIAAVDLGGVGAATTIDVDQVNFGSTIYVSSTNITTGGSGQFMDVMATIGTAANGDAHKVIYLQPLAPGDGFDTGDTITIAGAALGGTTPADNVTATVLSVGAYGRRYVVPPAGVTGGSGTGLGVIVILGFDFAGTGSQNSIIGIEVDPANPGDYYSPSDIISIDPTYIGGSAFLPDVTIQVSKVFGGGQYTVLPPLVTGGSGTGLGAIVYVGLDANSNPLGIAGIEVDPANPGDGYVPGDSLQIIGSLAGYLAPGGNITFDVDKIGLGSAITVAPGSITTTGGGTGLGAIVSIGFDPVSNTPNSVVEITVDPSNPGTGYQVGDTITIDGAALGGTTGVDDVTVDVSALNATVSTFSTVEPGDVGFFPIGDGAGYTLTATPTNPGDSIQYYIGTR